MRIGLGIRIGGSPRRGPSAPTTFGTTFAGETAGQAAAGFANQFGSFTLNVVDDATLSNGKGADFTLSVQGRSAARYTAPGQFADGQVTINYRQLAQNSSHRALIRLGGSAGAEIGYFATTDAGRIRVGRFVNGTYTLLADVIPGVAITNGELHSIRLSAVGTAIRARIWRTGQAEPTTWDISVTDSGVSAAGWAGIGGNGTTTNRFSSMSVGVGASITAPTPA